MLGGSRSAKNRIRKQNTHQICPPPPFTFTRHRASIEELLQTQVDAYLEQVQVESDGVIEPCFATWLNSLRDMLTLRQQKSFPRHKLILNGIVGTTGTNKPTIAYATQIFGSTACGDDQVGVENMNSTCFVAVMVAAFALD